MSVRFINALDHLHQAQQNLNYADKEHLDEAIHDMTAAEKDLGATYSEIRQEYFSLGVYDTQISDLEGVMRNECLKKNPAENLQKATA